MPKKGRSPFCPKKPYAHHNFIHIYENRRITIINRVLYEYCGIVTCVKFGRAKREMV